MSVPLQDSLSSPVSPTNPRRQVDRYPDIKSGHAMAECGWYRGRSAFVPIVGWELFLYLRLTSFGAQTSISPPYGDGSAAHCIAQNRKTILHVCGLSCVFRFVHAGTKNRLNSVSHLRCEILRSHRLIFVYPYFYKLYS